MIYLPQGSPVEAIRFGYDKFPDWAQWMYGDEKCKFHWDAEPDNSWGVINLGRREEIVIVGGDYICRNQAGQVFFMRRKVFENMFVPLGVVRGGGERSENAS